MSCQWQMGMLVMRPCELPGTSACSMCGRTLCMAHTVMGGGGPACPQCAASNEGYERTDDTEMAASREEYYRPYGGVAGYGQQGFFSPSDSGAMNQPRLTPRRPVEEDDYDANET